MLIKKCKKKVFLYDFLQNKQISKTLFFCLSISYKFKILIFKISDYILLKI